MGKLHTAMGERERERKRERERTIMNWKENATDRR